MGRGIDRQALVKALLETSTELGIRRRELADERRSHAETRALLGLWKDSSGAMHRSVNEAVAERDTVRHVLGCVELALAGREPSDDWPAVAHAVAALRAGKVPDAAWEPRGRWVKRGIREVLASTCGMYRGVVMSEHGWGVSREMSLECDGSGPETGTAGKLAAEAWLDAHGVEYERAEAEVEPAWSDCGDLRSADQTGRLVATVFEDGSWSVWGDYDNVVAGAEADDFDVQRAKEACVACLDAHGVRYQTRPKAK